MSGLAIFSLKYPSLLQFDNDKRDSIKEHNLKTLYGIDITPSDTYLRERLDELPASELRDVFTALIRQAQRGKVLEKFTYYNGHYLFSMDGTGYFSSHEIHCDVVKNIIRSSNLLSSSVSDSFSTSRASSCLTFSSRTYYKTRWCKMV